jgi:hypothetical protein
MTQKSQSKRQPQWFDYLGWAAAVLLVTLFLLNSFNVVNAQNLWYQLGNLVASLGLVVYSLKLSATANVLINAVWSIGAIVALGLILL